MLKAIGAAFHGCAAIDQTIPGRIRLPKPLNLPDGLSEHEYLRELREVALRNQLFKSYLGTRLFRLRHAQRHSAQCAFENPGLGTPPNAVSGRGSRKGDSKAC